MRVRVVERGEGRTLASNGSKRRVLVLGGGFAGIGAVQGLKDADVEVVLVDGHDYHTFQPLIYQVATDLLAPTVVGHPIRDLFHEQPNVRVHQATAEKLDLEGRQVQFAEMEPITYDQLVLALGARVNFFGVEGAQEHAYPMYTLADAMRIREHILERWQAADRDPAMIDDGALNVVIVGGGPTGVESAGAMAELYRSNFAKDYPDIPQDKAVLTLVEGGPVLFSMFKPKLQRYAKEALEKRGVDVALGEVVASVEPTRVTLRSGTELKAHTLVWGAGFSRIPSPPPSASISRRETGSRSRPTSAWPGIPRCSPWVTSPGSRTRRRVRCSRNWVRWPSSPESTPEPTSAADRGEEGEAVRAQGQGTMATIGRGAAWCRATGDEP